MDISDFYRVCINLDEREDRWIESQPQFERTGIVVERLSAERGNNPVEGCALSHFKVLDYCYKYDVHAMIFEDDVQFSRNIDNLKEYLKALDSIKWDMLYLGANVTSPIYPVSDLFGQLTSAQSTHAYLVNREFISTILACRGLIGKHLDLIYSENIVPYNDCFITIPMLATQRPSFSDIENRPVNYNWMEDRYKVQLEKGILDGRS